MPSFKNEDSIDYDDDKFKRGGRPRDNQTKFRTDKHFAGRDPIGSRSMSVAEASKIVEKLKSKKTIVTEGGSMLDESNIME